MRHRSRLRAAWRWSWVLTLPIAVGYSLWAIETWRQWHRFAVDYEAGERAPSLREVGRDRWNHMARAALLPFTSKLASIPAELQLPSIQLFVKGRDLAQLEADLPYSGFEFVDARLMYDDGAKPVKARYRGDYPVHWADDKKSIRIRTGTTDLFAGMREFNLIAPKSGEQVVNYLSYRLADLLGLLTPRCELVNVFQNGRYAGLYQLTEQLDEGTLRRHDRMPGDLYAGDFVGRNRVAGATNRVFESPAQWQKVAANNHYDLESRAPLEAMLAIVSGPMDDRTHARLTELLDLDAFGRFGALLLLTQTRQYDEHKNWRLYWDPWRRSFAPLIWDPMGFPTATPTDDLATSRLQTWLLQNGEFLAARQRALQRFFDDGSADRFDRLASWALAAAAEAIERDPNIRPTSAREVESAMRQFEARYRRILGEVRAGFVAVAPALRWARTGRHGLRFEVSGRQPIASIELRFQRPLPSRAAAVLGYRQDGVDHAIDVTGKVSIRGDTLRLPIELFAQLAPVLGARAGDSAGQPHRPLPTTYDLAILDGEDAGDIVDVAIGAAAEVGELPVHELHCLFRPVAPAPRRTTRVLRGELGFSGVNVIEDDVVIDPGTTIRLAGGASLLFRGRVQALGTEERPIRILPESEQSLPWGTIALDVPNCSGSRFAWCEMRGGSGYQVPLAEYCSMFSIHNCRDIRVEHCRFAENHQFDDMIHVMYGECVFDHVKIEGALSDALDCDISRVVIKHSTFRGSGNDAIDLMTTDAVIHDCQFLASGDKGISIGEGSCLLAVRAQFRACGLAFEAKDGSRAQVVNSEIRGCRNALNAYRKNWRYDAGGELAVRKSILVDNTVGPTADKWSRVQLIDCQTQDDLPPEFDLEYTDGTTARLRNTTQQVDCDAGAVVRRLDASTLPPELSRIQDLATGVWDSVRNDHRGVPNGN